MGLRNPFRFGIDRKTGWNLSGDVGSDAQSDQDKFNLIKGPGNYGWPYFIGNNQACTVGGKPAVASAPVNNSTLNTGLTTRPPAKPPAFWYAYNGSTRFPSPAFNMGGRVACAGSRYSYDASLASSTRLPPVFDGMWFGWDWRQHWIRAASMDAQGTLTGFLDLFTAQFKREEISRLTDLKVGPDGALYALQYGWVDYQPSTQVPCSASTTSGPDAMRRPLRRGSSGSGRRRKTVDLHAGPPRRAGRLAGIPEIRAISLPSRPGIRLLPPP